ncbi:GntP family transporter [Streptomyces acidiscabies]|uniref:GntP family transporter n=1 Tax=Streptomyces acidiscabies TaxID=42234 RepID=A0AAP6EGM0_9ACTN|nr:GntP family transporter [Streptomyces acidiscabies]MBZ3917191.1 GntP family transporter [Streptomyces acidiscabies]MDX2961431.1 GntP family transporter [Streptomyces acidiscabies]MDX3023219.1 GntP family transporter [Streptomyces acidiscabies]MDX3792153.1 GntP family transporter [Streptomyces acidiscabies]GAQ51008.1 inner membrane permease YgbN [Streptomyces acidiscabies]
MSHGALLGIAAAGVGLLLLLILWGKVQPFVALVVVSIGVALVAGVPAADLVKTIEEGMGATLGHIATIIALGAMIGRIIELSGGAHAFAHSLIDRFGSRRTPFALTVAGFVLGIPVFFEVGLIILMPIAYGVARASGKPLLVYALPMGAAMLTVHAFLPPHPGAVAGIEAIGASQGLVLLMGIPVTAAVVVLGYFVSRRMTRREYPMDPTVRAEVNSADPEGVSPATGAGDGHGTAVLTKPSPVETDVRPPSFGMVLALIVTPILLILLGTIGENALAEGSTPRAVLTVLGAPMVALLIDVALCGWLLGARRGWDRSRIAEVMGSALPPVAMVILVAGAGGVFGKVLVASGIGDAIADTLERTGLPALFLAFFTALALRAAQGSATVALITTAGILTPLLERADLSTGQLSLVALSMGAGALTLSHINDAGYWMFTRLAGLDVASGLRTWTVLTTVMGFAGFGLTAALWPVV